MVSSSSFRIYIFGRCSRSTSGAFCAHGAYNKWITSADIWSTEQTFDWLISLLLCPLLSWYSFVWQLRQTFFFFYFNHAIVATFLALNCTVESLESIPSPAHPHSLHSNNNNNKNIFAVYTNKLFGKEYFAHSFLFQVGHKYAIPHG